MSKYLSKADFLAGITCKPVDFEVEGLGTIRVRGLSTLESDQIGKAAKGENIGLMVRTAHAGLVEPKLDESDVDALWQGAPGIINKIAEKVMQLSGITEDKPAAEDLEKKAGSGS